MAQERPDPLRIARLERELHEERRKGFSCPVCGAVEFEHRVTWRGGDEKDNSGEWYGYWACVPNGHDVTTTVAPRDGVPPPKGVEPDLPVAVVLPAGVRP